MHRHHVCRDRNISWVNIRVVPFWVLTAMLGRVLTAVLLLGRVLTAALLLGRVLTALLGRVLTAMLGRACGWRVNEVQVIRRHHVCQDRNISSVNIRAVPCRGCPCP